MIKQGETMSTSLKRTGIWRFVAPLRIVGFLLAILYSIYYFILWGTALMGNTERAFDLLDIASTEPLSLIQIAGGMVCTGVMIGAVVLIVFILNRLLKLTYKEGFFQEGVAETFRQLGWALILFWLGMFLSDSVLPWLLTRNFSPELQVEVEVEWLPLDDGLIALFVGFVLLLVADAMVQARAIDEDNKQII